jgi:hypothetical protein
VVGGVARVEFGDEFDEDAVAEGHRAFEGMRDRDVEMREGVRFGDVGEDDIVDAAEKDFIGFLDGAAEIGVFSEKAPARGGVLGSGGRLFLRALIFGGGREGDEEKEKDEKRTRHGVEKWSGSCGVRSEVVRGGDTCGEPWFLQWRKMNGATASSPRS